MTRRAPAGARPASAAPVLGLAAVTVLLATVSWAGGPAPDDRTAGPMDDGRRLVRVLWTVSTAPDHAARLVTGGPRSPERAP
ncbi:hypothetical protein OG871_31685 [Kitasatospora sp. NBC_00374]|uniref:hypothetical protein n=1 Tax=Kitasatospora sp. NBC_00374 TaxID=2975964 RepID=UPI00324B63E3